MKRSKDYHQNPTISSTESTEKRKRHNSTSAQIKEEIVDQVDETHSETQPTSAPSSSPTLSPCSRVKVKKEEPEDRKCDIKVEPQASSSSSCTANDIKPVFIKHEFKKEEYDSDCDCNDCRVGQGKLIRITTNNVVHNTTQNQTDKHDDECGCNVCVQDRQVGRQVTDQAIQGANDQSVDLADPPTGDDISRSSTPDWMPSIFSDDDNDDDEESDDDETEVDDETIQDERDDDDDPDFSVSDEEELQNDKDDDDDTQEESDCDNYTPVPSKLKGKESKGKSNNSMEPNYKCLVEGCKRAFKRKYDLKRHNKVHTRERPFACTQCKSKFSRKCEVTRHFQNVHLQTKQWRCIWPKCKHRSGYRLKLVEHVKTLHFKKLDARDPNEYIKKCEGLSSEEEESSTEEEVGNEDNSKPKFRFITVHLNCMDCSKVFKTKEKLKQHQLNAHRIQQYRCLVKDCSASFEKRDKFTKHQSVKHRSCRLWSCRGCGHQLKTYPDLASHFRMKHQMGRYVCAHTDCTVEAETVNDIVAHCESVHQPAKHRCSRCKKRYKKRKDLLIHERTHTGDRPFACSQCDKRYTTNKELNKHIRAKHQSRKPYSCKWENCQHEDGYLGSMRKHVRVHFEKADDDEKRDINDFIERYYEPVTSNAGTSNEKDNRGLLSKGPSNKKKSSICR